MLTASALLRRFGFAVALTALPLAAANAQQVFIYGAFPLVIEAYARG